MISYQLNSRIFEIREEKPFGETGLKGDPKATIVYTQIMPL